MRRLNRRLARPLAIAWLLLSNSLLCLGGMQASASLPEPAMSHAAHHAGHHQQVPVQDAGQDCCQQLDAKPCCAGTANTPGFGNAELAKLPVMFTGFTAQPTVPGVVPGVTGAEHPAVSPPGGPPIFIRTCSLLI